MHARLRWISGGRFVRSDAKIQRKQTHGAQAKPGPLEASVLAQHGNAERDWEHRWDGFFASFCEAVSAGPRRQPM